MSFRLRLAPVAVAVGLAVSLVAAPGAPASDAAASAASASASASSSEGRARHDAVSSTAPVRVRVPLRTAWEVTRKRQLRWVAPDLACELTKLAKPGRKKAAARGVVARCVPKQPVLTPQEYPLVVAVKGRRHAASHASVHVQPADGTLGIEADTSGTPSGGADGAPPGPSSTDPPGGSAPGAAPPAPPEAPVQRFPTPDDVGPEALPVATEGVSVLGFGAVGDGVTDDTAAIQRALDGIGPNQTLLFPGGRTFVHTGVLTARVPDVRLSGGGVLLATREQTSAFAIAADRVLVDNLTFRIASTTRRWSALEKHKLVIGARTGVVVNNVTVDGSAAAGIYVRGATDFVIAHATVQGTRADGIHMTRGASAGLVSDAVVRGTGDDGIAVVSYLDDPAVCRRIKVLSPRFYGQVWGRAFSVVGGEHILYRDIYAENSDGAAVYIASEAEYNTASTSRVIVDGGQIVNANQNPAINHGAVMVYSSSPNQRVDVVVVKNVTVTNTRAGLDQVNVIERATSPVRHVILLDLVFDGGSDVVLDDSAADRSVNLFGVFREGTHVADEVNWPTW